MRNSEGINCKRIRSFKLRIGTDIYCLSAEIKIMKREKSYKEIVVQGLKINVKATRKISALPFEIFLVITHYFEYSDIRKKLYICYGLFIFV